MLSEQLLAFEVTDLKNSDEEHELEQQLTSLLHNSQFKERDSATIENWCKLLETGSNIYPNLYLTPFEHQEFIKYAEFNHDMEIEVKDFICLFSMIRNHYSNNNNNNNNNNSNNEPSTPILSSNNNNIIKQQQQQLTNNNNKYIPTPSTTIISLSTSTSSQPPQQQKNLSLRPSKIPIHQQQQQSNSSTSSPRLSSGLKPQIKSSSSLGISSATNINQSYPVPSVSYGIVETIHSRPMDRNNTTDGSFRSKSVGKRVSIDPTIINNNNMKKNMDFKKQSTHNNNNNNGDKKSNSIQAFDVIPNSYTNNNNNNNNNHHHLSTSSSDVYSIKNGHTKSLGSNEYQQIESNDLSTENQENDNESEREVIGEEDEDSDVHGEVEAEQRHQQLQNDNDSQYRPYRWRSMDSEDIKRQLDHDRIVQLENETTDLKNELKFYKNQSKQQELIEHHHQKRLKEMESDIKTFESLQKSNAYEHEKTKKKLTDEIQHLKLNLDSTTKQLNETYMKLNDSQTSAMKSVEFQNNLEKNLQQNKTHINKLESKVKDYEQLKMDLEKLKMDNNRLNIAFEQIKLEYNEVCENNNKLQIELDNHLKHLPADMTVEKVEESLWELDQLKSDYKIQELGNKKIKEELETVTKECEELKKTIDDLQGNEIAQLPGEELKLADLSFLEKDHLDKKDIETVLSMHKQLVMQSHVIRNIRISKQYKVVYDQNDASSTWKKMIPFYMIIFFMAMMIYFQYFNNQYKSYGLLPCTPINTMEYTNDNGTVLRKIISWIDKLILSDYTDVIQPY